MAPSNFERMVMLANNVFDTRSDSSQLNVNEEVINRLHSIHPATLSEYNDGNGPVAWILVFPTTSELMEKFIGNKISEQQLYDLTPLETDYTAIYLCSALVLPEYRKKGIATNLTVQAIENIKKDHSIKSLFVWPFSKEGYELAEKIAVLTGIPLKKKQPGISERTD
jgi:ribosomal protein S18 acetylase RimI-like enzyme